MNDDKARAAVERARQCREWCEGPDGLFAIFKAVEGNYIETLMASDIADHSLREKAYQRVAALRDVAKVMSAAIIEGLSAASMIEKVSKFEQKKRARP